MSERKPVSLGERWRREANRSVDDNRLEKALAMLPGIRKPLVRVRPGAIQTELEGAMGSINEVSIHVAVIPPRHWPQVARVLRRSTSMLGALETGRVPRSFDRLVARITGESIFPEGRRVTTGCTCGSSESPCRHVLALHELFARRLEEKPWELLVLRGANPHELLQRARSTAPDEDLPPLAFAATEEPVLFPEAEAGDLDYALTVQQAGRLLGVHPQACWDAFEAALRQWRQAVPGVTLRG
jgi:uncharacterized Zn finger protein